MTIKKGTISLKKQKIGESSKPNTTKKVEEDEDEHVEEISEEEKSPKQSENTEGEQEESSELDEEEEEFDDEVDISDVSSVENDTDDELEDMKSSKNKTKSSKARQSKEKNTESFSSAMDALLNSHLKAHNRSDPILVRQKKKIIKKMNDEKLELKAKRLLKMEKKELMEKSRQKDLLPKADENARQILDHERKLKKTAQRGVIKLFNAILNTQIQTNISIDGMEDKRSYKNDKKAIASDISKEKFLDMVKAAK